jgi:N-acetylmuramoyl-L-alanine amidase
MAAALGLWLAAGFGAVALAAPVATNARLGEHPEHTRFVLELSEAVDYRLFTLAEPNRIVLELPDVEWRLQSRAGIEGAGLVSSYRYGPFRKGRSRIVLDLAGPAKVEADFMMAAEDGKPARLVLDIVPTDDIAFLAGAGWPDDAARAEPVPPIDPVEEAKPVESQDGVFVIAIDAGHGGVDPGASGAAETLEKDVVLETALALKAELESRGNYEVVLTRGDDTFITLKDRVRAGRAGKADLFISLHADSVSDASVHGASVYTLSETASDSVAAELEQSENAADIISGVDLSGEDNAVSTILIDLAQRETKNRSSIFAQMLLPELDKQTGLIPKPHRFAGFRVLKAPDVPSVLIELGFLSNPVDEDRLTSPKWRSGTARAIARAVDAYYARMSSVAETGH